MQAVDTLDQAQIAALIPHGETMCLLDGVRHWDDAGITAFTARHNHPDNPLLEAGALKTIVLIEYAAQAAAVHAGLMGTGIGHEKAAFIGAVKSMHLHHLDVPAQVQEIRCKARCLLNNAEGAIYDISVEGDRTRLIEGRIVLVIP